MPYETLLTEQTGAVLKITLNRPEVLNALSDVLIWELDEAFAEAAEDDSVRVIILAGSGKNFCAGHDIGTPQQVEARQNSPFPATFAGAYARERTQYLELTMRWRDIPKPTVGQVQGYCIMGGLIVVSSCDLIVASEEARFTDRAVRWGSAHVQYASLPWDIGVRKAKECLFTGDWITAQEAHRLGLVNRVVPRGKLEEETMALAQRIAQQDPFALRMSKMSMNAAQDAMGFRNTLHSAFSFYMHGHLNMLRLRGQEGDYLAMDSKGVDGARERDERFGDQR